MKNLLVILFAASFAFASCGGDNAVSNAVNEATEAASDVANEAGEMAGDAANAVGDAADGVANEAGAMATEAFGKMDGISAVTATVSAVKDAGGITNLSPDVAASNVEGWIGTLSGMEGTDGIVGNLKTLKTELTKGKIDGAIVGPILIKLADETEALGKGNVAVNGLASALRMGGEKLSK